MIPTIQEFYASSYFEPFAIIWMAVTVLTVMFVLLQPKNVMRSDIRNYIRERDQMTEAIDRWMAENEQLHLSLLLAEKYLHDTLGSSERQP